jgi:hypothetical protein
MDPSVREVLERPFSRQLHRSRKGSHGKELKYVEIVHYVRRLNEATGGDWSFEIIEHKVLEAEVVVLGKLTVGTVAKESFGGSSITTSRDTGKALSLADDLKGAAADSLKKCASMLGIGLELYADDDDGAEPTPDKRPEPGNVRPLRPPRIPPPKESTGRSTSASNTPLTVRQQAAIQKLGSDLGMPGPEVKTLVLKSKGIPLEKLTTRQASELIGELQARLLEKPGRAAGGAR